MGVSAGLLGAALYFFGLFSGYMVTILLAGYILLFEENVWLRRTSVKAVAVLILFSLISTLVGLIPDVIDAVNSVASLFEQYFSLRLVSNIVNIINNLLRLIKTLCFLNLGFKALGQRTTRIAVIDDLINDYMP